MVFIVVKNMQAPSILLIIIIMFLLAPSPTLQLSSQNFPIAKPNCIDRCGNISIPFPFGTTEECYGSYSFWVTCNDTVSDPPKLFWQDSTIEITNISLDDGQIKVKQDIAKDCYDRNGVSTSEYISTRIWLATYFTVSNTANKFTIVGCDTYAYVSGSRLDRDFSTGCIASCISEDDLTEGSCTGAGCCEIPIPQDVWMVRVRVDSFYNYTNVSDFNQCGYAFVAEENSFSFSKDNLTNLRDVESLPMVVDWVIRNGTCEQAKANATTYACVSANSDCYKPEQDMKIDYVPIGIASVIVALLLAIILWYLEVKRRSLQKTKRKLFLQNGGRLLREKLKTRREGSSDTTMIFSSSELEKATNAFHNSMIIGQGGQGTVYKGVLEDRRVVAIKKSIRVDPKQIEQFINEVFVLSDVNHRNIVRLLGCCLETDAPLLVYEFITNGTLSSHLHNEAKARVLDWNTRLKIAAETAGVLSYLHSSASTPIIHRDVKSDNILLDHTFTAKVADFGASKLVPIDLTQLSTMVQGTFGYLDPEYMQTNQLTEKSDVYSFGVVLLELLTGRRALSFDRPVEEKNLANYFLSVLKQDLLFEIVDVYIVGSDNKKEISAVAKIAKECLNVRGEDRPSMKEVAMELEVLIPGGKHAWARNVDNAEEMESLLPNDEGLNHFAFNVDVSSSVGYDSITDNILLPMNGGR